MNENTVFLTYQGSDGEEAVIRLTEQDLLEMISVGPNGRMRDFCVWAKARFRAGENNND